MVTENVSLDLEPVIRNLARTQTCVPDLKLQVDRINLVKVDEAGISNDSPSHQAYRLWLTDRDRSIQAVLKPDIHYYVDLFDIREGSIIVLKDYSLERGKRLNGRGEVMYIVVSDFNAFDQESREISSAFVSPSPEIPTAEHTPSPVQLIEDREGVRPPEAGVEKRKRDSPVDDADIQPNRLAGKRFKSDEKTSPIRASTGLDLGPYSQEPLDESTRPFYTNPDNDLPYSKSWYQAAAAQHHRLCHQSRAKHSDGISIICQSFSPYARKAMEAGTPLKPVTRPLRLSTLASVTGINASRNRIIDVLAMVDSVDESTTKPAVLPLKRDVRITDPSTDRIVTVSVFVDPVNFLPRKDDVILFRNLTTHEYHGGNLNAYIPRCGGKEWYISEPYCIDGIDVDHFKKKCQEKRSTREKASNTP